MILSQKKERNEERKEHTLNETYKSRARGGSNDRVLVYHAQGPEFNQKKGKILASQEAEISRTSSRLAPAKSELLSQKYPMHKEGLVEWLKRYSTCLASVRP
jgi:hypothetical protein